MFNASRIQDPPITTLPIPTEPVEISPEFKQLSEDASHLDDIRSRESTPGADWAEQVRAELMAALANMKSFDFLFEEIPKAEFVDALLKPENSRTSAFDVALQLIMNRVTIPVIR